MAKTRTAEKPAQADAEEKTDDLEIISIGSIYKGPWDKKYWSSNRGKDRYPYPVGYQAIRAHNGTTYKMEIQEGVNGPNFLISSDDGSSSSGKTPDFAWEEFQKKGCPRMKIWHGKRLSSKMDGLELFGFKNRFIQRLLRELVADMNGIAERSLVSSNFCEGVSRTEHDDCRSNVGTCPDLLLCLGRPRVTGKRSRCELKNKKLNGGARPRSLELTCSRASDVKNEKSLSQRSSTTHYCSEEENGVHNYKGVSASLQIMSSVGKSSNCISSKNGLLLNAIDIYDDIKGGAVPSERPTGFLYSATKITENFSTEEPLHRSHDVELKMPSLLVSSEDQKLMQSCSKESQGCIDIDLCAPDTLDFVQENSSDSAPSKLDKNAYSVTACEITSGDLLNAEHEVLKSNSNRSSEKSDSDSVGQDVAKSMMSLLLPQAVPLLRNVSTDKEFTISPSDMFPSRVNSKEEQNGVGYILDVSSSDVLLRENAHGEQGIEIHGRNSDPCSNTPNSEHMKSIVPDSFDYSQCEDLKINQEILSSVIAEAGRSNFNKEMCSLIIQEHIPVCDLPLGSSTCHASELDFKDRPQECDAWIPESVLDDISPKDRIISERSNDDCSDLKENPVHAGFNSLQKDRSTAQDFTAGVKTKSCHLKSMETLAEKTHDEVVGKTGNVETMIMSSQLPNLVYTRRKLRNGVPLQRDCSVMENTERENFELVTAETPTAKGMVPHSETIQINNSKDKPCEPDHSAGFCVETPQNHNDVLGGHSNLVKLDPTTSQNPNLLTPHTHTDVLDGHSNLVELNPTSSQNPNLFACENKCSGAKEAQFISEPMPYRNQEVQNNLGGNVKFVGCYLHPMPVTSLFLSRREDEIHICVLCGLLMDEYRTLFTYKVAIKEPSIGCPSVMAHTSILLPNPKHNLIRETAVERSSVQLTPDGQYIVLIGSIKTPNCREQKIDCYCSTCTSVCSGRNALKIVQVEHGYVSVVATLETVDNVHCILVCEPNRLVSVGESGRLEVWVMNSTWSEKMEYFIIPADGFISPDIVELKKVPKCAHLVVGRNSSGEFSLWDIAKLNCVSSFSALKNPINEFFPISLFHWQTKGSGFNYVSIEEQAEKLLEATNLWYSEQRETCSFLQSEEGDVAMWLLLSTASDLDCDHNHVSTSTHCDIHTTRSWRLALCVKNSIVFGRLLDPRTTGIDVLGSYGIISTNDGVVYLWELSRGSKLGTLHHFQDGNVTCIATDDSRGALGVAGGGGKLLLYLHLRELDSN